LHKLIQTSTALHHSVLLYRIWGTGQGHH